METRRSLVAILCGCLSVSLLFAQQAAKPQKVLTPEQKVFQQQWKEYMAKRSDLQAQAKQILDAVTAREKAGDCPAAHSTYDFNVCFEKLVDATDASLKGYEEVIRKLLAPGPEMPGQADADAKQPAVGVAGPVLSSGQLATEFEQVEKSWQQYRETACTAAFHQFEGGSGGPSFELECELKLARDHIRELNMIYGEDLEVR
jgi:uncharacterized protein YecT (DUF1311 family)